MIELEIRKLGVFMGKLFSSDCFDSFLITEAAVRTNVSWALDSRLLKSFYTDEEWNDHDTRPYEFATWSDMRPIIREIIKGKKSPVGFQLVFRLKPEYVHAVLKKASGNNEADSSVTVSPVDALYFTVKYDGAKAIIITGIGYSGFTLDKSAEPVWDRTMTAFLDRKEIEYDEK